MAWVGCWGVPGALPRELGRPLDFSEVSSVNAPLGFTATLPRELVDRVFDSARALGAPLALAGADAHVAWQAVAAALNGCAALDDAFAQRFAAQHLGRSAVGGLLSGVGLTSRGFAELLARGTASVPLCFESTWQLGLRRLDLAVRLREGLTPCAAWWRLAAATLTRAPTLVGRAPLAVHACVVSPTALEVSWEVPAPTPGAGRVPAMLGQLVPLLEDLEVAPRASGEHETLQLQRELGLTRAEARVAHRVASGLTPREVAAELNVAWETVRTHLRNINARLELTSQRELVSLIERRRAHRDAIAR